MVESVVVDVPPSPALSNGGKRVPKRRLRVTMLGAEAVAVRVKSLRKSAAFAHNYDYNYRSWIGTTLMLRDRAASNYVWPWALTVLVASLWVSATKQFPELQNPRYDLREFERVYTLIFSALGFLLVFRLTRAAVRYWDCRAAWWGTDRP